MSTMTLEELLRKTSDEDLLNIHLELQSCIVPATGYSHAFCRKVNRMIDAGKLCVREDSYRKIYLPTLAKAVLKEMASRYANYCRNMKGAEEPLVNDGHCVWCNEEFDESELHHTDIGMLCDRCIAAITSRGERLAIYD